MARRNTSPQPDHHGKDPINAPTVQASLKDDQKKEIKKLQDRLLKPELRRALFLRLFFAWGFAFSFSQMYFPMLWMPARPLQNALWIALNLVVLLILSYNKFHSLISLGLAGIAAAIFFLTGNRAGLFQNLIRQISDVIQVLNDQSQAIFDAGVSPEQWSYSPDVFPYVVLVQRFISSALAILAYLTVTRYPVPLLLSSLLLLFLPITYMAPSSVPIVCAIPTALFAILAGLSEHNVAWSSHFDPAIKAYHPKFSLPRFTKFAAQSFIPVLIAAIIALAIIPTLSHRDLFSPTLQGFMDDLSSMLPRSYLEKLSINDFSLSETGYYPLRHLRRIRKPLGRRLLRQLFRNPLASNSQQPLLSFQFCAR